MSVLKIGEYITLNFTTVIDELTLGITDVVRGEDLQSGMSSQLAIIDEMNLYSKMLLFDYPEVQPL